MAVRAVFRFSILVLFQALHVPSAAVAQCPGDCDGNDAVEINEVVAAIDPAAVRLFGGP